MFQNSNREVLKELAKDNYGSHKSRNRIAVLAITLTTLLITAIWTVGISFISTISNYGESAPGPGCEGSITGTPGTLEQLRELPQIKWADMVRPCSMAGLHNEEFAGMDVRLLAPDETYFEHNFVELLDGRFAQSAEEVVISDTMAKRLGVDPVVGSRIELLVMTGSGEEMQETPISFTITGYYKNPLINISDIYDEIYTVPAFIEQYNPSVQEQASPIYVKLDNLNPLLMKTDVMAKLQEANDLVAGKGIGTKHTNSLREVLFGVGPALLLVLFIVLSGYFLIYNVFYISVSSDIRWFGMMKTLGTTAKQLKKVLMQQIRRLALIGIVIGNVLGYLLGNLVGPKVMGQTIYGMFYEAPNVLAVWILGAVFSWFTVYVSALKSLKLACRISPVEAARFSPKKKKNIFTILSITLSGTIFLIVCNVTLGFSVDRTVERYNMKDAKIFHDAAEWNLEEPYQPISDTLPQEIAQLPFVTGVEVVYHARIMPDYSETAVGRIYSSSMTDVALDGALETEMNVYANSSSYMGTYGDQDLLGQAKRNRWRLGVVGIPADMMELEMQYAGVCEGTPDWEKFAAGEGIIWVSPDIDNVLGKKFEGRAQAGDVVTVGFYDDEGNCTKKELTILGVLTEPNIYGRSDFGNGNIILSDTLFCELYPNYEERISSIEITTQQEITPEQHQQLNTLLSAQHNTQLNLESRSATRMAMSTQKQTFELIGFLLAGLLGMIGISNLVNSITSDVFARKLELAAMQSIGMTKKQMWAMLFTDTMKFMSVSVALMLGVGGVMSYLIAQSSIFTGFHAGLFLLSAALLLCMVTGICVFMTWMLVRVLNRKSIVERLREIE